VVVLSHGYWQRRFGSSDEILGQHLTINGAPTPSVGVTPPASPAPTPAGPPTLWVPVTMANEFGRFGIDLNHRNYWWMTLGGATPASPGTAMDKVQARANLILQQYLAADPELAPDAKQRARAKILLEDGSTGTSQMRRSFREPLLVLMAGVGLLLLIVCLNVSYLLLARATRRQYELSIRTALGPAGCAWCGSCLAEGLLLAVLGASAARR
jgi:hypothetical protein